MNQRIWITGAKGRIGQELYSLIKEDGYTEITTTDTDVDVSDLNIVTDYARMSRPDIIINLAGMTNPEECEKERIQAYKVNTLGARNVAVAARTMNAKLIHLSTDDIFDGTHAEEFNEFDTPVPISTYAKTKLAGEMMVKELAPKHVIIRSSWVYGKSNQSFVNKVIQAAKSGNSIEIVEGLTGTPTSVKSLSEFLKVLIPLNEYGIFHASCEGSCSREAFVKEILSLTNLKANISYKSHSYRPNNAKIENLMMKITGIFEMPDWKKALKEYIGGMNNE